MTRVIYTNIKKDIVELEKILIEDFKNICDWFVDKKLSIHFGDDKTKLILFASKQRTQNIRKLNARYEEINKKTTRRSNICWMYIRRANVW